MIYVYLGLKRLGAKFSLEKYELIHFTNAPRKDVKSRIKINSVSHAPNKEYTRAGSSTRLKIRLEISYRSGQSKAAETMRGLSGHS